MKSVTSQHFPPVLYSKGRKLLWDRIRRKPLENRPEERVRLQFIDYLTLECHWPGSRIASESHLESKPGESLRADLVCYNERFQPSLLIECKADRIKPGLKTSEQIAKYNLSVRAEKLCITNGVEDYWFEIRNSRLTSMDESPLETKTLPETFRNSLEYWQKRGFAGTSDKIENKLDLTALLQEFWSENRPGDIHYLNIKEQVSRISLNHYYRIQEAGQGQKIAASFMTDADGDSFLVGILNKNSENKAVLIVNLDKWASGAASESVLITKKIKKQISIRDPLSLLADGAIGEFVGRLPGIILRNCQ